MAFRLSDEILTSHGFEKMPTESFIISVRHKIHPLEQWRYNDVVLSIEETDNKYQHRFFNIQEPGTSMRFNNERQFKEMMHLINQGKTILDIWMLEQEHRGKEVERMLELRENPPFLEDYRYNDIGGAFFYLAANPEQKIYMTYEKHATSAYYYSLNDLSLLEHSKDTVHIGNQTHSAIGSWFLCLESYVNALIKLCCLKKGISFKEYKKKDVLQRIGSLARLLGLDIRSFYQGNIIARVNEFACFRNDLFHDRHFADEVPFDHTEFSPIPIFSCQVDIMQAVLILIEVTSMLRYAITGLDTMPSVILQNEDVVVWEKLDIAYEKILQPWFTGILAKHNLRTKLNTAFTAPPQFTSDLFTKGEVKCNLRVDQEQKYEFWLSQQQTNIGPALHHAHLKSLNLAAGTMRLNKVVIP